LSSEIISCADITFFLNNFFLYISGIYGIGKKIDLGVLGFTVYLTIIALVPYRKKMETSSYGHYGNQF
jgi:hypothetical protein